MIKLFGRVFANTTSTASVATIPNCIADCYSTPDCILAFMDFNNHCLLYNYSTILILNVTETAREDGYTVAFKVDLPSESCPSSPESIDFCGSTESDSFCWNTTETGWVITNMCPDPWKKFERDESVTVCMRAFYDSGITRDKAMTMCENQGFKLTGVASDEESKWMNGQMRKLNSRTGFWLDGQRTPECVKKHCSIFEWTDGYTVGSNALNSSFAAMSFTYNNSQENCLVAYVNAGKTYLNDVSCTDFDASGFFCGFQMMSV